MSYHSDLNFCGIQIVMLNIISLLHCLARHVSSCKQVSTSLAASHVYFFWQCTCVFCHHKAILSLNPVHLSVSNSPLCRFVPYSVHDIPHHPSHPFWRPIHHSSPNALEHLIEVD